MLKPIGLNIMLVARFFSVSCVLADYATIVGCLYRLNPSVGQVMFLSV